ncbi:hypothetical protein ANANG_G00075490 [Anguilla anguilla]|uniref:MADF domain-containing protein n=1 Tax=Anguilla anguilla TaxID=7936 RepID=A0A9D3RZP9_ANGAN|nr:hypothetical protein ANANG_G00075490 [Anguilla anguilla]
MRPERKWRSRDGPRRLSRDGQAMAAFMEQGVQMEFPWNRLRVLELIDLYKIEDVLWNISNRDYHNKAMRQAALVRLSAKLAAPVHEVNKKLMNLRTYYSKELAKVKRSRVRAAAAGAGRSTARSGPTSTSWTTSSARMWCPASPTHRWSLSSFPEVRVARERAVETPPLCGGAKRHREDLLLREAVRAYKTTAATASLVPAPWPPPPRPSHGPAPAPAPPREDVDGVFGRHVANELRLVGDLRAKQYAKLQIQNILFQAQFGLSSPFPSSAGPPSPDGLPLDTELPRTLPSCTCRCLPPPPRTPTRTGGTPLCRC